MSHDARDERFLAIVDLEAAPEFLATGLSVTEGTVWHPREQYLVYSDIPSSTQYRWTEATGPVLLRTPSNLANGNTFDRKGRLVTCEHATSSVRRWSEDGRYIETLATQYRGKAFNSPNDLVVDSRGRIWFTDPTYGRVNPRVGVQRDSELGFRGVFRLDPDGSVALVADDFGQPNGLCLTPDESALLVNDTERSHIRRFAVAADGATSGGDLLADIAGEGAGRPDGMKVDVAGRIYCTGPGGVHVLTAGGGLLGVIRTPMHTRNFCFGGADARTLFLAVDTAVCRMPVKVQGVLPGLD